MKKRLFITILMAALLLSACGNQKDPVNQNADDIKNQEAEPAADSQEIRQFGENETIIPEDSELKYWGLSLEIKNVTTTGATLVFQQTGGTLKGNLEFGADFTLLKHEGEEWKSVPVVVEENYGFNDIAYPITKDLTTEYELDWEWLYGELEPGEYKLGKRVFDVRETGYCDEAFIYGYFVLE